MNKEKIRQALMADLSRLTGRSDRIDEHWRESPPADWEELSVFRENDEVINSLDERAKEQILEIKRAFKRMDDGEWLICSECGEPIQEARLEALPTTTLCVKCAAEVEREAEN